MACQHSMAGAPVFMVYDPDTRTVNVFHGAQTPKLRPKIHPRAKVLMAWSSLPGARWSSGSCPKFTNSQTPVITTLACRWGEIWRHCSPGAIPLTENFSGGFPPLFFEALWLDITPGSGAILQSRMIESRGKYGLTSCIDTCKIGVFCL